MQSGHGWVLYCQCDLYCGGRGDVCGVYQAEGDDVAGVADECLEVEGVIVEGCGI